jgi:spore cortex formation protein SpoVR/YcgB (stage V sporulation)
LSSFIYRALAKRVFSIFKARVANADRHDFLMPSDRVQTPSQGVKQLIFSDNSNIDLYHISAFLSRTTMQKMAYFVYSSSGALA